MSNYSSLKATINANIKQNGNEEITGPILNSVLNAMVDSLAGYHYSGIATPATNPGAPDSNVFYIASEAGTYTNFGSLAVAEGEVAILKYNGTWTKEVTGAATAAELSQLAQKVGDFPDKNLSYGQPTSGKYVNYSGGQLYDSGVNSAITGVDVSRLVGRTLYYSRAQIPASAGNQGIAFYGDNGYISGVQGAVNAPAWGIALDTVVVPNGALTASFTCPTAELSSFQLYVKSSAKSEIEELDTELVRLGQKEETLENDLAALDEKIDNEIEEVALKFGYEKTYAWVSGTYTEFPVHYNAGIKIHIETSSESNELYFKNSSEQNVITVSGVTERDLTLTQEQAESIVKIAIYGGDYSFKVYGINDEIEELKQDIDDSVYLTSSGSYTYKKIEYNFKAFGFYKVTVKNTTAASIGFQGLVDATSDSGDYQFTLKSGESILWTPAKSYEALYFGAAGSFSIEVEIYGPSTLNKVHTFYCGPTRQYTKITDAIKAATLYMNSVLFVDEGEYDIISELGADYFNMTESDYNAGPVLKNGIQVIATPGAKIVCHYTGSNETVMRVFSPLNSGPYGFTLSGVHIEASRVRYAIHDELNSTEIPTKCRYENCFMSLDNSNNPVWGNASCIGGGLAAHAVVDVLDSIFHPISNEYKNGIYYHEAAVAQDFDFKINIAGNYLIDGAIIFQMTNEMQGKNNYITVHDNNVPNDARLSSGSVVVKDGVAFTTNVVLEWNNIKRS